MICFYLMAILISACAGEKYFDQLTARSSALRGYIVVAGAATAVTAPGTVGLFDSAGNLVRQLRDHYTDAEVTSGIAIFNNTIYNLVDGSDRVESNNPQTSAYTTVVNNPNIAAVFRHMTVDTSGYLYILETNTGTGGRGQIEKADLTDGTRIGAPFINTDTGAAPACALQVPQGVTYVPSVNRIAVVNNAGNLLLYNASTGACAASVNNAQFTGGNPRAIVYHAATNKYLIAKIGTDNIVTANVDGTSPTVAYSNATRVLDPYAIAVDADGYVYVGSAGQDTIEKFSFNGTTMTPVSTAPLIPAGIYTQNPTAIAVFQ